MNVNKVILLLALAIFAVESSANKSDIAKEDGKKLSFSDSVSMQIVAMERAGVINQADELLNEKPRTIAASSCPRSSGGKHDFFSEGPYWWPDPANPNGPYIRKDGLRNPNRFNDHDNELGNLSQIVGTLTSAYILTGNEKYVKPAMVHLNAWFVDTATMMNPNMQYAQAIQGICTGRGIGIIDALPLMDVALSVLVLEKSPGVSAQSIQPVKKWFGEFLKWLTTHQYGIDEMNEKNNHGTWWHVQAAVYARLTENNEINVLCREHYKNILLPGQMAADGSYPLELARTNPFGYSLFNLDATASLAWILSDKSFDLWNYSLPDGRGLRKGLDFIKPYIVDKSQWPYNKDIAHWESKPEARKFMLFAALALNNREWFSLWKSIAEKNNTDENRDSRSFRNPLLWINIDKSILQNNIQ